jgi:hypothetical protein
MHVMTKTRIGLNDAERAVFELVVAGAISEAHGALYPKQLAALTEKGLIKRAKGRYVTVEGAQAPERPEPMVTLVVRIPAELMARIDSTGRPNRSEAAREALEKGVEVMRKAKTKG